MTEREGRDAFGDSMLGCAFRCAGPGDRGRLLGLVLHHRGQSGEDLSLGHTPTSTTSTGTPPAGESDTAPADEPTLPKGLDQDDVDAGLLSATVKWQASGDLKTVPGTTKAPGRGKVLKIRVQVEKGVA